MYRNDGGHFTDVATAHGLAWGGRLPNDSANGTVRPCVADVDGDGHLDIVTANYGRNGLFLNRGHGKFEDASSTWWLDVDSHYDTCALDDFDNDGRIDLYVNGTVTGGVSYPDYLYRNTGTALRGGHAGQHQGAAGGSRRADGQTSIRTVTSTLRSPARGRMGCICCYGTTCFRLPHSVP